ncbi:anthocyanin 3'-O-beta-glucosyltransferase [Trifolium pratense]|uniref:Anthocyanin 3'-O-beta-glucosyltransferase n=1 Tax=Trifolium pratense TaxID=57577 RepID=A0A2K3MHK3_TRIPR|nr:anthocyanin 3'-O-beta-glucosyltransferase [Trifolium pratense]
MFGVTANPGSPHTSFESFGFPFNCRKRRQGLHMIWQATCWAVWKARNSMVFEGIPPSVREIVEAIKRTSLRWLTAKRSWAVCLAYEWQKSPLDCLLR